MRGEEATAGFHSPGRAGALPAPATNLRAEGLIATGAVRRGDNSAMTPTNYGPIMSGGTYYGPRHAIAG